MREPTHNKARVFTLVSPSGREYRTSNEQEAKRLVLTAGYQRQTEQPRAEAPAAQPEQPARTEPQRAATPPAPSAPAAPAPTPAN